MNQIGLDEHGASLGKTSGLKNLSDIVKRGRLRIYLHTIHDLTKRTALLHTINWYI